MKKTFLATADEEFDEWLEDELCEYGKIVRKIDSLDFFIPQWNAVEPEVIIFTETIIQNQDEQLIKLISKIQTEKPKTLIAFIYYRENDGFIQGLISSKVHCIHFSEIEPDLLAARLMGVVLPQTEDPKPKEESIRGTEAITNKHIEQPDICFNPKAQKETEKVIETGAQDKVVADPKELSLEPEPQEAERQQEQTSQDHTTKEQTAVEQSTQDQISGPQTAAQDRVETEEIAPANPVTQRKKSKSLDEQRAKIGKIRERIIIHEKIVKVHVPVNYNSVLISLVSLYPAAGATFVTSNFARLLGENKIPVAVLEPVSKHLQCTYYDLLHGDKNAPENWMPWSKQLKQFGYINQENSWEDNGVQWIINGPETQSNWESEDTLKLLLAARRFPVTLCDISSHYDDPSFQQILDSSDEIWLIADGDPVRLSQYFEKLEIFKKKYQEKKLKTIGNRWNKYIKESDWNHAVGLTRLATVPDLGPSVIGQLWEGKLAWDSMSLKNQLHAALKPVTRSVLSKEMFQLVKKQYGFVGKMRNLMEQLKNPDDEKVAK